MSQFVEDRFSSDKVEESFNTNLIAVRRWYVNEVARVNRMSFIQMLLNPPPTILNPDDPDEPYDVSAFISDSASTLRYELQNLIQYSRLNKDSKALVMNDINKLDSNSDFLQLSFPGKKIDPQAAYDLLKAIALPWIKKYETLGNELVRESATASWKPFLKNLFTLFGFGFSAISRLFFGEYLYGDKLTISQAQLDGYKAPAKMMKQQAPDQPAPPEEPVISHSPTGIRIHTDMTPRRLDDAEESTRLITQTP